MKKSQTTVEKTFLIETLNGGALFHSETTPIKVCNLFMTKQLSDIRLDQTRTALVFAKVLCG